MVVKKIVWGIVALILCFTVVVCIINRDKIELVYTGFFMSAEKLQEKAEKSQRELIKTLEEQYGINDISEIISGFDEDMVFNGEVTIEELEKQLAEKQKEKIQKELTKKYNIEDIQNIVDKTSETKSDEMDITVEDVKKQFTETQKEKIEAILESYDNKNIGDVVYNLDENEVLQEKITVKDIKEQLSEEAKSKPQDASGKNNTETAGNVINQFDENDVLQEEITVKDVKEQLIEIQKEKTKEELKQEYDDKVADDAINRVDEDKLLRGEITVDDIKQEIEDTTGIKPDVSYGDNDTKENSAVCKAAVEKAIKEMYVLKSRYSSQLGSVEGEIVRYYNSLMRQKGMTRSKAKLNVANTYSERLLQMQSSCDSAVNSVLGNLTATLNENGGDTGIVSQIRTEYENAKNQKINYYMSVYNG